MLQNVLYAKELKTALAKASEETKKERKRTEQEYRLRADLLERIEGFYGTDDGFCNLKTETLTQIAAILVALAKEGQDRRRA